MRSCLWASCFAFVCLSSAGAQTAVTPGVARDLVGIGEFNTGSGKIEVHVLSAASRYQQSTFNTPAYWGQGPNPPNWVFRLADMDGDGKPDLVGISQFWTVSNRIEIHVASAAGNYQQETYSAVTPWWTAPTPPNRPNWTFDLVDFDGDGTPDLVGIANFGMASHKIEVHILSGASGYQTSLCDQVTPWAETANPPNWVFRLADMDGDGKPDLVGIGEFGNNITNPGTNLTNVEVHALSAASNFQQQVVNVVTPWGMSWNPPNWTFSMVDIDGDARPDLVGVANYGMVSGKVEMHALSGASHFQQSLTDTVTPWAQTPAPPNGPNWTFEIADMTNVPGAAANVNGPGVPPAVAPQGITSLYFSGADHAYYIAANQHICQSYVINTLWVSQDLTALAGTGALAAPGSRLTSVLVTGGDHVYYFDTNGHVNQLYSTGAAWINQDLTALAQAGTPALPGSAIGSLLYNNADHVFYLDTSRRVNHLWWTGQQWQNEVVPASARFFTTPPPDMSAAAGSGLNSVVESNGRFDLYYVGNNQHISHFWGTTGNWYFEDLSCVSTPGCGVPVAAGSSVSGLTTADGKMHLFYADTQPHISHMPYSLATVWSPIEDLTKNNNIQAIPDPASGLSSFARPDGSLEVYYVDQQRHINQLESDSSIKTWSNTDLSSLTNTKDGLNVLAAPQTALTSLLITGGNHVYYVGTDKQVHQIYWDGQTWVNQNITMAGSNALTSVPAREYIYFNGRVIATENGRH